MDIRASRGKACPALGRIVEEVCLPLIHRDQHPTAAILQLMLAKSLCLNARSVEYRTSNGYMKAWKQHHVIILSRYGRSSLVQALTLAVSKSRVSPISI